MTKAYFKAMRPVGRCRAAMEASPQGPTTWHIGNLSHSEAAHLNCNISAREALRFHPNAPEWVRVWMGPFEIYVYNDE